MSSKGGGNKITFGNISNEWDFSNLFGGGNVFNLGAGSSNTMLNTKTMDLSSMLKDSSTNKDSTEFGNIQADLAASVGVGVGGGSGSAGAVDKTSSYTSSESMSGNSSGSGLMSNPLILIIGGAFALVIFLMLKRR